MAIIGVRDVINSLDLLPVKKLSCKFDVSGDSRDPIITNKHVVRGGSCNIFEIISIGIDVPLDLTYSPVLTVYIYDTVMGFLGTRIVGVTNIPLLPYCEQVLNSL
jgi:hypothetical protein